MANIYGVCPERSAQHKGYGDFVQHTNPLKEEVLLTLSTDNSLIGLISVREPELVNLLIQLNYRESRESANSLIQLNSVDSTESVNPLIKIDYNESLELANSLIQLNYRESRESANSLIIAKTCIAETSPNVLMKSDASHLPSTDGAQKAQKKKGSTVNAAFLHNVDPS